MTSARGRRLIRAVISVVLAVLSFAASMSGVLSQSGDVLTLAEYETRLEQTRAEIAAANGQAAQRAVEQAAADLDAVHGVMLPDGARVDLEPLVVADTSPENALAQIDAVLQQLQGAASDNTAERFASLDTVLASQRMNRGGPWAWLLRLLARLFGQGSEDAANQGFDLVNVLLTVVGAGVLVLVLSRIVQAALGSFMRDAELREESAGGERPTVAGARRRAAELAQAGSYREAVRQLYLVALLSLEDRGLLRIDRSLTNREVLQSLGRWTEVHEGLRPVVETFEVVWYGEREPDRETFEQYSAAVESAAGRIAQAASLPSANASAEPQ